MTPDDLTSVGRHLAVDSPKIRVWDRVILDSLVNRHLPVLRDFFGDYPTAVKELTRRLSMRSAEDTALSGLEFRLRECPTGREHSGEFENIGCEILMALFAGKLANPRTQIATVDDKQRRDSLFRNNRTSPFFQRIFDRFGADFVIVDYKNYAEEIDSGTVTSVEKYGNDAIGHFILVVSRKGLAESARATQVRTYRDDKTIVLVISDDDLLEMVRRKQSGQMPEDILEDKLDALLTVF